MHIIPSICRLEDGREVESWVFLLLDRGGTRGEMSGFIEGIEEELTP